jgi:DNA-binding FadR family transcriptional regulator
LTSSASRSCASTSRHRGPYRARAERVDDDLAFHETLFRDTGNLVLLELSFSIRVLLRVRVTRVLVDSEMRWPKAVIREGDTVPR